MVYAYDEMDDVKAISINSEPLVQIQRDERGLKKNEYLAPGLQRSFEHNADGQLTNKQLQSGGAVFVDRRYEYDPTGNLITSTEAHKGKSSYTYDPMCRVIKHINPGGKIKEFLYDPAGDLLRARKEQANSDDSRTSEYDGTRYRFDAAGNLIQRKDDRGHTTFEWDGNNNLIAAEHGDGQRTSMGYDPQGRRIAKQTGEIQTQFTWDGDNLLSDSIGNDGPREFVFYPNTFEPLAMIDQSGKTYYFENDLIGLPHEMCDVFGHVAWSAQYGTFGEVMQLDVKEIDNPIRLQGQYYDEEIDLCYNYNRYYDQKIGCFICQDPLGLSAGHKLYWFAPNVWSWIDPLGLECYAHAAELQPNKYLRKGECVTKEEAIDIVRSGGDVIAKDKHAAKAIAEAAGEGFPIHHLPHRIGQTRHYHATVGGRQAAGHAFY